MNIIIIDGDYNFTNSLVQTLKKINKDLTKEHFNVKSFTCSEDLIKSSDYERTDLFIISIENVGSMNGIDFAKLIRNKGLEIPLIFLSYNSDFSMKLHELRILNFILKTNNYYSKLKKSLKYLLDKENNKKLKIIYKYQEYILDFEKILYIDSFRSKKIIKYYDPNLFKKKFKEFYHYTSFYKIENKLLKNNFIQIRRSTYINKNFIFKRDNNVIKMIDGTEFFIGFTFKNEVNDILNKT